MLSGCKILQWITAVSIVLILLATIAIMSQNGGTSTIVAGVINLGIAYIFYKIYKDCARRQDILEKYKYSVNPDVLESELKR